MTFKNGRTGFRPDGKEKGKVEDARNGDAEKGIPQHTPKKMANQELSKESELKEGKNEKKRKRDLPRRWEQDVLCLQKSKTGEPTVPQEDQKNSIIKGGDGL